MTDFVLLALTPTVIVGLVLFMQLHPLNDVFMRTEITHAPYRFRTVEDLDQGQKSQCTSSNAGTGWDVLIKFPRVLIPGVRIKGAPRIRVVSHLVAAPFFFLLRVRGGLGGPGGFDGPRKMTPRRSRLLYTAQW